MSKIKLSRQQRALVQAKVTGTTFLEGPAGTGKTTVGVQRALHLLDRDVPAGSILAIVPQRTLALPFYDALRQPGLAAGEQVTVLTFGGLARRMVDVFWPLVAADAGFRDPKRQPTFLSLETSQYYMASLVRPLIEIEGYFESVHVDRNRIYSEIIDNLNKAAVVGFPHTEIAERLKSAWIGEEQQRHMYDDVQKCATLFREYCVQHNLLDFSLQAELFRQRLWKLPQCYRLLLDQYTHLIVDNIEEDNPLTHAILEDWLAECDSALVIYDTDAGYRRFLGSDPDNAYRLAKLCEKHVVMSESFVTSPDVQALGHELAISIDRDRIAANGGNARSALIYEDHRYYPQMIDWVADEIARLVHDQGVAPGEIVVMAPFLSDALRFALMNRLEARQVPARSHRPSRALREEAAAQCMLTLAQIAHPAWGMRPTQYDLAYALMTAIDDLDLVRAQLLAQIVYRMREGRPTLSRFDQIQADKQARITYVLGERYEKLRAWIADYVENPVAELDHFFSRLFGEVLSQQGYGFHADFGAAEVAANLIDSAQKFRRVIEETAFLVGGKPVAHEYVEMVREGVIADQYIESWHLQHTEAAVLLAPAYTFLMSNRPVDYQFWLNVGSEGWWERLYQPLTHPYVLSLQWKGDRAWTDADEYEIRKEGLYRLVIGLVRRCRQKIYLGFSEMGEQGDHQRGPLLQAVQRMLRRTATTTESHDV